MLNAKIRKLAPVIVGLILSFSSVSAQECGFNNAWARAVRRVAEGIIAADNKRDLKRVLSFYTPDAILIPPGEPTVKGVDAIRLRYESLFANYKPQIEGRIDQICLTHRLASVVGHTGGRLISINRGKSRTLNDDYLMLISRQPNRTWRVSRLSWTRGK